MASAIGIDIGRASATGVKLRRRGSSLAVERVVRLSLDELRAAGIDTESPQALANAVAQRLGQRGLASSGANLGVSGKDAIIRYAHFPPMPPWRLALVMKYDIADTAEKTGAALSSDFRTVGIGDDGGSVILVAMAKDERVSEWVRGFERAGFHLGSASPRPTAVGDAFRFLGEDATKGTTLVFDVGRSSTEVALVSEGALLFARSVAQGGEALTDRLAKRHGLSREEAEAKKLEGGDDVAKVLEPGLEQIAAIARASLEFARVQLKMPKLEVDRVAVTGGAARTPGLVEAIGKAAGVPATLFDPLAGIDQGPLAAQDREAAGAAGLEATAACGLALAQLMPSATSLDLLPNAVKAAREWRERTVWLYAAGAVAALYLVVAGSVAWMRSSGESARAADLKRAQAQVDGRVAAKDELAQANAARAKNLQALAGRARTSYSLAALLATLGRELPPRVAVSDLVLVRDKDPRGGDTGSTGADPFHFELRGSADNSRRDALEALRQLEAALARDPDLAEVKVTPAAADGPSVEFSLVVRPKGA